MTETYQSIGSASTPAIAAIGALFAIVDVMLLRLTKIDRSKLYPILFLGIWYIVCGLLALPIVLLFAVTFFISPSYALISKQVKTLPKLVMVGFFSAMAACMAFLISDKRIVLSDKWFQSQPTGFTKLSGYDFDQASFPRSGLTVSAFTFASHQSWWLSFAPRWGWDIDLGDKSGPYFSGDDYFWGPHGLVRGDTLGKHIAEWSGKEPKYKRYN